MTMYMLAFALNWMCNILFLELFCLSKLNKVLKTDEDRDS